MPGTFNRVGFTELWIVLQSDKTLGILDSDYLEDYNGTDGYISIYNTDTQQRFSLPMAEVEASTPEIPHDVFKGFIEISEIPDGHYVIQGRVRSVGGSYVVLDDVAVWRGDEAVVVLDFNVAGQGEIVIVIGPAILIGGVTYAAQQQDSFTYEAEPQDSVFTIPPPTAPTRTI